MRFSEREILASLCRQSFVDFVQNFWSVIIPERLSWSWHMELICNELQTVAERIFRGQPKLYDLVINVPPGSSKSTICSIMFPAWCWTRMPSFRFIGASYSYYLAMDLSRKGREVVKSELYQECFPDVQLSDVQDSKGYYVTTKGGQRYTTGSGGSVQGMHAHCIGIDDPLDPEQALSEKEMYNINSWISSTLSGRKVDRRITPMILVMQRLHQADPTAVFLQKKRVKHICIPARLSENVNPPELRENYVDGLMDPNRFGEGVLLEAEHEFGPYGFAGQFQQTPIPQQGGMFNTKLLKYAMPDNLIRVVRYWDKAGTANQSKKGRGAWTVGVKMGIDEKGRIFILNVVRVRLDSYDREKLIHKTAISDGVKVKIGVEQEGGSGGKESAQGTIRGLHGFSVIADRPVGDKETRADPFSTQVNGGNVIIVPGDWNDDYVEEMKFFPFSTTKDQIDASSGAYSMLVGKRKRVGAVKSRRQREAELRIGVVV